MSLRSILVLGGAKAAALVMVVLGLLAVPAVSGRAQVPQDTSFTGRLVDAGGIPLVGPVLIELRIFDAETSGTQLYSEEHVAVPLDAMGGFAVQLGLGTNPSGPFDAVLFSDIHRWLEVVVGVEVMTPRQIIGSVPWAMVAQQANEIVPDPNEPLKDCGNGTVADSRTGLLWEKKTGTVTGTATYCASQCTGHDVNESYSWSVHLSSGAPTPDGTAFRLISNMNSAIGYSPDGVSPPYSCFLGYCDWRLPNVAELDSLVDCSHAGPCIDPIFGPTNGVYWTSSTFDGGSAWYVNFFTDQTTTTIAPHQLFVRAVRAGSCR